MLIENLKDIKWNSDTYNEFKELLYSYSDDEYKEYVKKVNPNVDGNIGVRIPILRNISKNLIKNNNLNELYNFLEDGKTFEEQIIQGMIIPYLNYEDETNIFNVIDMYILRIDNWMLCDTFVNSLKISVSQNKEGFFLRLKKYIRSANPWEIRFGLNLLETYFVDDKHIEDIFLLLKYIENKESYVIISEALLINSCFILNPEITFDFLQNEKINNEVKKKSIQKILESKKVAEKDKDKLKEILI